MKYIVVTGGVVSGLGKGVTISSMGRMLQGCGLRVTSIKIDPYLNVDAGTMSPFEHGEVCFLYMTVYKVTCLFDCFAADINVLLHITTYEHQSHTISTHEPSCEQTTNSASFSTTEEKQTSTSATTSASSPSP